MTLTDVKLTKPPNCFRPVIFQTNRFSWNKTKRLVHKLRDIQNVTILPHWEKPRTTCLFLGTSDTVNSPIVPLSNVSLCLLLLTADCYFCFHRFRPIRTYLSPAAHFMNTMGPILVFPVFVPKSSSVHGKIKDGCGYFRGEGRGWGVVS